MKPIFTAWTPHSMFWSLAENPVAPTPVVEPRKFSIVGGELKSVGMYLHGTVQAEAGFDEPCLVEGVFEFREGRQEVAVELPSKNATECFLYLWDTGHHATALGGENDGKEVACWKGLIVDKNDAESIKYAEEKMAEKSFIL